MRLKASDPIFIDVLIPPNAGRNDRLDRIDRLIDWPKVAAILDDVHAAPEGRPAYRPITMVKIIVLQQWHDASDVGMEEALRDRLSFRRFAELTLTDAAPDHSTISRFRKKITERGLARMLFAEVNRQLEAKGMLVKRGTLIDATVIEAQARRPQSEAGARSGTDPDAAWTKKGKQSHFGCKIRGEDAANAAGEGTTDGAQAPSFLRRRESCPIERGVGPTPFRKPPRKICYTAAQREARLASAPGPPTRPGTRASGAPPYSPNEATI